MVARFEFVTTVRPSQNCWRKLFSFKLGAAKRSSNWWAWVFIPVLFSSLAASKLAADELAPNTVATRTSTADLPWRDAKNSVSTTLANHTDEHGRRYQSIVFLLRDPSGRFVAVGLPDSVNVRDFLTQWLESELAGRKLARGYSETQIEKLRWAGSLDTARLMRRIERVNELLGRDEYRLDAQKTNQLWNPIAAACAGGLFNELSLLHRVSTTFDTTPGP